MSAYVSDSHGSATPSQHVWSSGLLGCFDNLCPTWLICCIQPLTALHIGQLCEKLGHGTCSHYTGCYLFISLFEIILTVSLCPAAAGTSIIAPSVMNACSISYLRYKVRQRDHIDGSFLSDCLLSFICNPCTLGQLSRHVYKYPTRNEPLYFNQSGCNSPDPVHTHILHQPV